MKKNYLFLLLVPFLVFAQTGNVGINTENPQKNLDVNGNFKSKKTVPFSWANITNSFEVGLANRFIDIFAGNGQDNATATLYYHIQLWEQGKYETLQSSDYNADMSNSNHAYNQYFSNRKRDGSAESFFNIDVQNYDFHSFLNMNGSSASDPHSVVYMKSIDLGKTSTIGVSGNNFFYKSGNFGYIFPKAPPASSRSVMVLNSSNNQMTWKDYDAVILKSPNGSCYRITVDDNGNLSTASATCN